ncbi:MAG: hypothetical protein J6B34_01825 [Clostridia bacterium]|nr:hypothetical protein [Clostridia bacterium]
MKKFQNVISLGHFCSVAMELERIGLRKASYPFDWVIASDFEKVCQLLSTRFEGFLEKDSLLQEKNPKYYFNEKTEIHFYHDFSPKLSLDAQYEDVKKKFERRIKRLFEDITTPTLFIRYITNKRELEYILNSKDSINELIKKYNPDNEIIYISSVEEKIDTGARIFYIEKDKNDTVARRFLDKSSELKEYILSSVDISDEAREKNIKLAKKAIRRRKINGIKNRIQKVVFKILPFLKKKPYRHTRQYVPTNKD